MSEAALAGSAWPERDLALDGIRIGPIVSAALRIGPGTPARAEALLIKQTGERRCVIRYRVGAASAVGKLYRDRERGARAHRRLLALRDALAPVARDRTPEPIAWLPELGMMLQEWRGAGELRDGLVDDAALAAAEGAADWLAALHAVRPLPGLKQRTLGYEVSRIARFAEAVAGGCAATSSPVWEARDGLSNAAAAFAAYAQTTIHKDFYYAHVLWDGSRVSIVDFDELSAGDAAFDVGHFLGHLDRLAARTPERAGTIRRVAERFQLAYPGAQDPRFAKRVRFYRGYTALKLAATEVRRAQPGWERSCNALVELAVAHARGLARGGD